MSKTIEKHIHELFEPENGNSKYTKTYCSEHSGDYIVYTGTTIGVFGKVDSADYSTPNLTFTTDGEKAGTLEYITDEGYCIGGHRTILKPLSPKLDLLYFKFILQPLFYINVKKGDVPSLHFNRIKNKKVQVPIKDNGEFDLERQKELAKKYQDIEQKKKQLLEKAEEIKKVKILINRDNGISYKKIPINSMFKHNNGKSIYTKEYCRAHSGPFPVFSANNQFPIGHMKNADYSGEYLTYSKNGCAGYITIMNGDFSVNGDRCVLTFNDGYENIDLLYLKYLLEPIFRANIKGRIGINGKNEYTKINSTMIKKLNISIPIPIKEDGSFDIEKQRELAQKYAVIDSIKDDVHKKIIQLTDMAVV